MVNPNLPKWVWDLKFQSYTLVEFPAAVEREMELRAVTGECDDK